MKRSCLIKSIACFVGLLLLFNGSSANETKVVNHSMDYISSRPQVLDEIICQPGVNLAELKKENTRYIIKYGFDLKGKQWKIPSNSFLIFEGGYIGNGILVGNNTCIEASPYYIFDSNLSLEGTWINSSAYPEWFGAKGDGKNDDRMAIQKCINSFEVTHFLNKSYLLNSLTDADKGICINIPEFKTLEGEYVGNAISHCNKPNVLQLGGSLKPKYILHLEKGTNVIRNISIYGNGRSQYWEYASIRDNDTDKQIIGIGASNGMVRYNRFENIGIAYCYYAYKLSTWMTIFDNCSAKCCVYGMRITGGTTVNARNCYMGSIIKNAYYFSNLIYSKFETLAADGCGWGIHEADGANAVYDDKTYYIYKIEGCNSLSINNSGQEIGFKTFSFVSSEYCDVSGFFLYANQIENSKITRNSYIYVGKDCRAITLKNIRHNISGKFIKVEGNHKDANVPKVILDNIGGPEGTDWNNIDVPKSNAQYVVLQSKQR